MTKDEINARIETMTGPGHIGEHRSELTHDQTGQWLVLSLTSAHLFDLDRGLVARIPGNDAIAMITDRGRPLREIVQCRVGEVGFWTMEPFEHEHDLELRWHQSSFIQRIVQVVGLDRLPGISASTEH